MVVYVVVIYDWLVSFGVCYLQFQLLMSEGVVLCEGYQFSVDNWGCFMVGIW